MNPWTLQWGWLAIRSQVICTHPSTVADLRFGLSACIIQHIADLQMHAFASQYRFCAAIIIPIFHDSIIPWNDSEIMFKVYRILFLLLLAVPVYGNADMVFDHYKLDVTLDVAAGRIYGTNAFAISNTFPGSLDKLPLFAYPNHYSVYGQEVTHELYDRVFPEVVSLGSMQIHDILINDKPFALIAECLPDLAQGVILSACLANGSPPVEQIRVAAGYSVNIPERFGSFGMHRATVCLNGGWYPYLPVRRNADWDVYAPPPKSSFNLHLNVSDAGHVFINGRHYEVVAKDTIETEIEARYLSLVFMPQTYVYRHSSGNQDFIYYSSRPRPKAASALFNAASLAVKQMLDKQTVTVPEELILIEVPLRRDLAIASEGVVLVSDRFHEVFAPLRDYHAGPLVEAVYTLLLRSTLAATDPAAFDWEAEAVAWVQAQAFWQTYRRRSKSLATYLKPFGFIPDIDALLNAPRFPFVGAFFGDFYETDPLREDILRFNRRTAHGRILAEKLRDLLGDNKLNEITEKALASDKPLMAFGEAHYAGSLSDYLSQWDNSYPRVNYKLTDWEQKRRPEGGYLSRVSIRQTGAPVQEPVVVEVERRFGEAYRGIWMGEGDSGLVTIETPRRAHSVQLDPDRRLRETTRSDNRYPPSIRVLLNSLRLRIDLNNRDHEIRAGGSIIMGNDYRNRYRFDFFSEQERQGLGLRHMRAFGKAFDAINYQQRFTYGFIHADLDPNFATAESGFVNSSGTVSEITLDYAIYTKDAGRNPLDGAAFSVQGEFGHKEIGGDFRYWKISTSGKTVVPLRRDRHLLAFHARFGASDRDRTPTQMLYDIGGFNGIRGINRGRLLGNYKYSGSAEYRKILWKEMKARGLSMAWTRMLQTVVYVDAGNTSGTIEDLTSESPHWGVGVGLRFYTDILGVFPTVVRFDVARQMDRPRMDDRPMYYIGAGQSF